MNPLEKELDSLKSGLLEMWHVVISQLETAQMALETNNTDLAGEVHATEKLLDAFELKHDEECENILANHHPVEMDLRFVLAVLKINYNLERIGDYANSIANTIRKSEKPFDLKLIKVIHISEMFEISHIMLVRAYESLKNNDDRPVRNFPELDKKLDGWKRASWQVLSDFILHNPDEGLQALHLSSLINKLERVGDHNRNIANEIIFYLDDKIMKHKKLHN